MPDVLHGHPNPVAYPVAYSELRGPRAASSCAAPASEQPATAARRATAAAPTRSQASCITGSNPQRGSLLPCQARRAPLLRVLGRARVLQRLGPVEGDRVARLALLLPHALLHRLGRLLRRGLGILACTPRAPRSGRRAALCSSLQGTRRSASGATCAVRPPGLQTSRRARKLQNKDREQSPLVGLPRSEPQVAAGSALAGQPLAERLQCPIKRQSNDAVSSQRPPPRSKLSERQTTALAASVS